MFLEEKKTKAAEKVERKRAKNEKQTSKPKAKAKATAKAKAASKKKCSPKKKASPKKKGNRGKKDAKEILTTPNKSNPKRGWNVSPMAVVGSPLAVDVRKRKAILALEELTAAMKDVAYISDFAGPPPGFDKKFLD